MDPKELKAALEKLEKFAGWLRATVDAGVSSSVTLDGKEFVTIFDGASAHLKALEGEG